MWTALARGGGLAIVMLAFMMQALRWVLTPLVNFAASGPHAADPSVQRVAGYFAALSIENLTLIALIGIAIHLLGRAAVERQVT